MRLLRYEVPADSTWWITYDIVSNPCTTAATLTSLGMGSAYTSSIAWVGEARAVPETQMVKPPFGLWADDGAQPGTVIPGFVLDPGARAQIVARVQSRGSASTCQRVPALALRYELAGTKWSLPMAPDSSLCPGPLPPTR